VNELFKEELKKEGVEIAEEAAKAFIKALLRVIPKVIIASENKYDDLLLAVLPVVEPILMNLADDINKEDNE